MAVGVSGLYIRLHLPETPVQSIDEKPVTSPIVEAFRTEWRMMLRVAGFNVLNAVAFYMIFVYVATYLEQIVHIQAAQALFLIALAASRCSSPRPLALCYLLGLYSG